MPPFVLPRRMAAMRIARQELDLESGAVVEAAMNDDDPSAQAVADLAQTTGVAPDEILVVSHERVTWRDGSLGCPRPGMMYTQALVDGYRIVLRAEGRDVHYHGRTGKRPFRCDNPNPNGALDAGSSR